MNQQKRKRGVRASRAKLNSAMLDAGIKTQLQLAQKIADAENLASVPKDLVNKTFRQENVSPNTIARIALVLNVEAYRLYLSKEESDHLERLSQPEISPSIEPNATLEKKRGNALMVWSILGGAILTLGVTFYAINLVPPPLEQSLDKKAPQSSRKFESSFNENLKQLVLDKSIAVYATSKNLLPVAEKLALILSNYGQTVTIEPYMLQKQQSASEIRQKFQADYLLTIRAKQVGRLSGLQLYLLGNKQESLIWSGNLLDAEMNDRSFTLATNTLPYIQQALSESNKQLLPVVSESTQNDYLNARKMLEKSQREINIKRAKEILLSVIQVAPSYADAFAALCEATLLESWIADEKKRLESAENFCQKAQTLNPDSHYVKVANAALLRRTGHVSESIQAFLALLNEQPNSASANSGIASAFLDAHRQQLAEFPNALSKAVKHATKATQVESSYWQHFFNLGIYHYYNNDIDASINVTAIAGNLDPTNELVQVNLGTMLFCKNRLEESKQAYLHAEHLNPNSYLGKENLANVFYYQGDFRRAAEYRQAAIDLMDPSDIAGIHQIWGKLGDALRHVNQPDNAANAYRKAITVIKRDILRGNAAQEDKLAQIYYQLYLSQLDRNVPEPELDFYLSSNEFDTDSFDTASLMRLAMVYFLSGHTERAKKTQQKAIQICESFRHYPDLNSLNTTEKLTAIGNSSP